MKPYTILQPKNTLYKKAQKRLKTVTFNCEICRIKNPTFTDDSIVTKETDLQLIHVLNYCPKCLQRFPIRVNLEDNSVSIAWPSWDDKTEDGIYPRKMEVK